MQLEGHLQEKTAPGNLTGLSETQSLHVLVTQ